MTTDSEQCVRCDRHVSVDDEEFCHGEGMTGEDGDTVYVCRDCLTPGELRAIAHEEYEYDVLSLLDPDNEHKFQDD